MQTRRDLQPTGYHKLRRQAEEEGEVVDLVAALRESVERTQKQQKRRSGSRKRTRKAS